MLKIRLQGIKKDIHCYLKGLNRDPRSIVDSVSDFRQCKKLDRFHMVYVNVLRKDFVYHFYRGTEWLDYGHYHICSQWGGNWIRIERSNHCEDDFGEITTNEDIFACRCSSRV